MQTHSPCWMHILTNFSTLLCLFPLLPSPCLDPQTIRTPHHSSSSTTVDGTGQSIVKESEYAPILFAFKMVMMTVCRVSGVLHALNPVLVGVCLCLSLCVCVRACQRVCPCCVFRCLPASFPHTHLSVAFSVPHTQNTHTNTRTHLKTHARCGRCCPSGHQTKSRRRTGINTASTRTRMNTITEYGYLPSRACHILATTPNLPPSQVPSPPLCWC